MKSSKGKKPWSAQYQFAHAHAAVSLTWGIMEAMPAGFGAHFPGKGKIYVGLDRVGNALKRYTLTWPQVHKRNHLAAAEIAAQAGYETTDTPEKQLQTWLPVWLACHLLWLDAVVACPLWTRDPFWKDFLDWANRYNDPIEDQYPEACDRAYEIYCQIRKTLHRGAKAPL